jgi:signal peptidase I
VPLVKLATGFMILVGLLVGLFVVLLVVSVGLHVIRIYRVPSSSMEPRLHCAKPNIGCLASTDDRIAVLEYVFSSPKRGDIVAFNTPPKAAMSCGSGGVYIKRVIGLPGDTWAERGGVIYIDGKKLAEPYLRPSERDTLSYPVRTIAASQYFVMGDNRSGSCDSRRWGTVPRKNILGKLVATYWPPSRVSVG